jgi:transcriptional regulator with XRE-family HTH domain
MGTKLKELPRKLIAVRQKLGLTQTQMAKRIGLRVSPGEVAEYESGFTEPDLIVLMAYSELAAVNMEVFAYDELELPE